LGCGERAPGPPRTYLACIGILGGTDQHEAEAPGKPRRDILFLKGERLQPESRIVFSRERYKRRRCP